MVSVKPRTKFIGDWIAGGAYLAFCSAILWRTIEPRSHPLLYSTIFLIFVLVTAPLMFSKRFGAFLQVIWQLTLLIDSLHHNRPFGFGLFVAIAMLSYCCLRLVGYGPPLEKLRRSKAPPTSDS